MNRVAGKVALITGAARGQGRSHAVTLAAEGADIIAVDACSDIETTDYALATVDDLDATVRLVEKEGRRAVAATCDVRVRAELARVVGAAVAEFGGLHIVVANAGIAPLNSLAVQGFVDVVDVNLIGAVNAISVALPHLGESASIIAIGSFAAFSQEVSNRTPGAAGYSFAKKALAHYGNDLSLQLAPARIRANVVRPTTVNTPSLHSRPIYKKFLPGVDTPPREAAEAAFPVLQAMPIPYVEA